MVAKADQARVRDLITETITLLCKNGLNFQSEFSIQALIGVTLDRTDVFLVNIDQTIKISDDGQRKSENPNEFSSSVACNKGCKVGCSHLSSRDAESTNNYESQSDDVIYASVDADLAWVNKGGENGFQVDSDSNLTDVRTNVGAFSSPSTIHSNLSQNSKRTRQRGVSFPVSYVSANANQFDHNNLGSADSNAVTVIDNDPIKDKRIEISSIPMTALHLNADHYEIKEEPADNDAGDGDAYENLIFSSYNDPGNLFTLPPSVDPRDYDHHSQYIQQEMGNSIRSGGKTRLSLRRRSINGSIYRIPRNNICNLCGKAFEKKRDLRGHLAAKHQMQKDHKCEICGKEFSYKRSLTDHTFIIHGRAPLPPSNGLGDVP